MTKGEFRVGTAFNPSGDDVVANIKAAAAALIDLVEAIPTGLNGPSVEGVSTSCGQERARLKALAQTAVEEAAMWAVKAATKKDS
jgi:hypothetical protein